MTTIKRSAVVSWILYDLANTIFSMGIVSMTFSLWVKDQVGAARVDSVYGPISSVSMGIIFIISPLLGAMSDRAQRRMPFLIASTVLCVALTMLFARVGYWGTIVAFIVANAAYQAGLQFYDSLLAEVTTVKNRGRIGGIGVGIGYLGSYIAVALSFVLDPSDHALYFSVVAMLFLGFAIPCFVFVKERGNPNPGKVFDLGVIAASTRQTLKTLREGERYPGLLRFLLGRVFYTDAINTVITFMVLYATSVGTTNGMTEEEARDAARLVMMAAITFAVIGGLSWGWVVDRNGPKKTLDWVLYLWMATFLLAAAMGLFNLPFKALWIVACAAGVALGGIWSADRPLMLRLTPPDRIGEFYGLYGMVGRFSAIVGPLIWSGLALLTIQTLGMPAAKGQGIAMLVLMAMVVLAYWIMRKVTDTPRNWPATEPAGATAS